MMVSLEMLGWDAGWEKAFAPFAGKGWYPARIIRETKINYSVIAQGRGDHEVALGGRVWHEAQSDAELPTVGDWVAVEDASLPVIRALLPRRNRFSRKMPGRSCAEQVIGANVDVVVVVTDAEADFNLRRLERYLALVKKCGARPVVLVNKADVAAADVLKEACAQVSALGVEVYPVAAQQGVGFPSFLSPVPLGMTVTVVGSSGVGKSTLVNSLLGEECLETGGVNGVTGKGRHTTVARELVVLPDGGVLIDNPGMREVQMWTDAVSLRAQFADLEALARKCRFADCSHQKDAGCAIRAALESGDLPKERYSHFLRLDAEIEEMERRCVKRQMALERVSKREKRFLLRNKQDRDDHLRDLHPNRRQLH